MLPKTLCVGLVPLLALTACSDDDDDPAGAGSLSVLVEAEDTITEGLDPGTEGENITDGWQVRFDNYIVAIGAIDVHLSTDETVEAEAPERYVLDLTSVPAAGLALWQLDGLQEGRWEFNYETAADGASRHDSVQTSDYDAIVADDLTYLIRGTVSKSDGVSCPPASKAMVPMGAMAMGMNAAGDPCYANPTITFEIGAEAETSFGPCEIDEQPGFSVTAGNTQSVAMTIHGDHLFFNGFPEGDEGGVTRLAQWFADCDLDLDGIVTEAELAALAPADLSELDDRFQLGGSPITPLDDMWTYLRAQLKTQGHFQGEGECPVDGVAHDH